MKNCEANEDPRFLFTSSVIARHPEGYYPYHLSAVLTEHETIRHEILNCRISLKCFDAKKYPWQVTFLQSWFMEYFLPAIITMEENRKLFLIPHYEQLGCDMSAVSVSKDVFLKLINFREQFATLFQQFVSLDPASDTEAFTKSVEEKMKACQELFDSLEKLLLPHYDYMERHWPNIIREKGETEWEDILNTMMTSNYADKGESMTTFTAATLNALGCVLDETLRKVAVPHILQPHSRHNHHRTHRSSHHHSTRKKKKVTQGKEKEQVTSKQPTYGASENAEVNQCEDQQNLFSATEVPRAKEINPEGPGGGVFGTTSASFSTVEDQSFSQSYSIQSSFSQSGSFQQSGSFSMSTNRTMLVPGIGFLGAGDVSSRSTTKIGQISSNSTSVSANASVSINSVLVQPRPSVLARLDNSNNLPNSNHPPLSNTADAQTSSVPSQVASTEHQKAHGQTAKSLEVSLASLEQFQLMTRPWCGESTREEYLLHYPFAFSEFLLRTWEERYVRFLLLLWSLRNGKDLVQRLVEWREGGGGAGGGGGGGMMMGLMGRTKKKKGKGSRNAPSSSANGEHETGAGGDHDTNSTNLDNENSEGDAEEAEDDDDDEEEDEEDEDECNCIVS